MKLTTELLQELTKDELISLVLQLTSRLETLEQRVAAPAKDSHNSSKPPSSDMAPPPKRNQSLRQKSGRKPGGQKGHTGHTRSLVENPDAVERYEPLLCRQCGRSLSDHPGEVTERRQEREIPPIQVHVTEHQRIGKVCACGCHNAGIFPTHITAPVQIGQHARSFLTYLSAVHHLPYARLQQVAADLFGFDVSEGSIDNILTEAADKAKPFLPLILQTVKSGKWAGGDETGMRVGGKRWWMWVWQHARAAYYVIVDSRGYDVVKEHFGEDFQGSFVHDCYSAQNNTSAKGGHQQCHPHLLRELKFVIESENSRWAYQMVELLCASERARSIIWEKGFDPSRRKQILADYDRRLSHLLTLPVQKKGEKRMRCRFRKHQTAILFFMRDPDIPFHNNDSEKAIRNGKVKQKISGCFRSAAGANRYATLLSVIETCRRQKRNILQAIEQIFSQTLSLNST